MKKKKSEYDIPYSKIIGAIKREFSRSETVKAKFNSERIEKPNITISGKVSKKPLVFFKCNHCTLEFKREEVQCDHIDPVTPIGIPQKHFCMDMLINKTCFVDDISKLQILCKPCHTKKSTLENAERRAWKKKTKYIVYCTTNKINWKKYIGVHKCVDLDDGYLGSGYALKAAIEKYGKFNFFRKVLFCFATADEAYDKEKELVNSDIVNNPSYYNLSQGGRSPIGLHPSSRDKLSKKLKGRVIKNKATIEVTATNLITGEVRKFTNIRECSIKLKLSYSSVLKVCKRRYGMSTCMGWAFETDKYGKSLDRKHCNKYVGVTPIKNRYSVYVGSVYLGSFHTLLSAVEAQSRELSTRVVRNARDESFKLKYESSIRQALKDIALYEC
jgi:hypothetical protein